MSLRLTVSPKASSLLPSNKNRSLLVHSLVKAYGLLSPQSSPRARMRVVPPTPADDGALAMYHSRAYLDFILDPRNSSGGDESARDRDPRYAEFGIEEVSRVCLCVSSWGLICAAVGLSDVPWAAWVCPARGWRFLDGWVFDTVCICVRELIWLVDAQLRRRWRRARQM
jgi:hypothetical protein